MFSNFCKLVHQSSRLSDETSKDVPACGERLARAVCALGHTRIESEVGCKWRKIAVSLARGRGEGASEGRSQEADLRSCYRVHERMSAYMRWME